MEQPIGLDCRVLRWFIRCESLELKHADPRRRAPFASWRMNRAMPSRTVEEKPRVRAGCRMPATKEV